MSAQPTSAFLGLISQAIVANIPPTVAVLATSVSASPDLTAVGAAAGLAIGATVITPSAAAGKTVVAIDNAAHTATLSGDAGITGTETFTFSPPSEPLSLTVGLYTANAAPGVGCTFGDLTEPTFAGYSAQAVTIGALRGDAAGDVIIPLGTTTFQPTAPVSPEQVVIGFYAVLTGTNTLLTAELLATPWPVTSALDALDVNDDIYIPADTVWGGICATCAT